MVDSKSLNKLSLLLILFLLLISCKQVTNAPIPSSKTIPVYQDSVFSKTLNTTIQYNYSLPETYTDSTTFPIIYLLHGHGGNENDWFREEDGQVADIIATMVQDNAIPPMIAVSVGTGESWYVDSVEPWETFYLNEFIPFFENKVIDLGT